MHFKPKHVKWAKGIKSNKDERYWIEIQKHKGKKNVEVFLSSI